MTIKMTKDNGRKIGKKLAEIELLKRQNESLKAQLVHTLHFADIAMSKVGKRHFMASGVILSLRTINGADIFDPVMIRDGLSDDTIAALRRDIARSYNVATDFKPMDTEKVGDGRDIAKA